MNLTRMHKITKRHRIHTINYILLQISKSTHGHRLADGFQENHSVVIRQQADDLKNGIVLSNHRLVDGSRKDHKILFNLAVIDGNLDIVKCFLNCVPEIDSLNLACENGHLHILKYFLTKKKFICYPLLSRCSRPEIEDFLISDLNLFRTGEINWEKLKNRNNRLRLCMGNIGLPTQNHIYIYSDSPSIPTSYGMDLACKRGHLDILQFGKTISDEFEKNRLPSCTIPYHIKSVLPTRYGMENACINGHIDVIHFGMNLSPLVQFPLNINNTCLSMLYAAKHGHLDILKMGYNLTPKRITHKAAIKWAIHKQWLDHKLENPSYRWDEILNFFKNTNEYSVMYEETIGELDEGHIFNTNLSIVPYNHWSIRDINPMDL